jgi:hypothetical protein
MWQTGMEKVVNWQRKPGGLAGKVADWQGKFVGLEGKIWRTGKEIWRISTENVTDWQGIIWRLARKWQINR